MQSFERRLVVWQNQQEARVLGKRGEKVSDRSEQSLKGGFQSLHLSCSQP